MTNTIQTILTKYYRLQNLKMKLFTGPAAEYEFASSIYQLHSRLFHEELTAWYDQYTNLDRCSYDTWSLATAVYNECRGQNVRASA